DRAGLEPIRVAGRISRGISGVRDTGGGQRSCHGTSRVTVDAGRPLRRSRGTSLVTHDRGTPIRPAFVTRHVPEAIGVPAATGPEQAAGGDGSAWSARC